MIETRTASASGIQVPRSVSAGACFALVLALGLLAIGASAESAAALKVRSHTTVFGGNDFASAKARCPKHYKAISGGFRGSAARVYAFTSRRSGNHAWKVSAASYGPTTSITAFAYCSTRGPLKSFSATVGIPDSSPNTGSAVAHCDHVTPRIVSGGFSDTNFLIGGSGIYPFASLNGGGRAWKVSAVQDGDADGTLKVYAYCARKAHLIPRRHSGPIGADSDGSAKVSCHHDERVVSGGFSSPNEDFTNDNGIDPFYSASHRVGARSWKVAAHSYGDVPGHLVARALCQKR